MKTNSDQPAIAGEAAPGGWSRALIFAIVAGILLAIVFNRSFSPEFVLFSNDAPLGLISSEWCKMPGPFKGFWVDLNWLGSQAPSAVPNISFGLLTLLGPLAYAKFMAPASLFVLGFSAWLLFRVMGVSQAAAVVGGVAAMMNMDYFSNVVWGLGSRALAGASVFLAIAAIYSHARRPHWAKIPLAGMAVGMAVMEGYDVGAIFSLYIAAFVVFVAWIQPGDPGRNALSGALRVAVVAGFAAFMAASAVFTLIETQVKGVANNKPDSRSSAEKWIFATQWSLPVNETIRVLIPGVYGYGMPEMYSLTSAEYGGANYWGRVGQSPGVEKSRFSGSGEYAGVAVVLIALWAVLKSFASRNNPFDSFERKCIWFWLGAAVLSLMFAWGRFAPFYQVLYALPYFSTIRNPIKFMHPFHIALLVLFGHGLHGIWRVYLAEGGRRAGGLVQGFKTWWPSAPAFEKKWVTGSVGLLVVSVLGWLIYAGSKTELVRHLEKVLVDPADAASIAGFSIRDVGWYCLFLACSLGLVVSVMTGFFAGSRARWAAMLLGLLLFVDLARANSPWIIYYDYKTKYAMNPVIETLKDKPYERRVQTFPSQLPDNEFTYFQQQFYFVTLLQNLFQYYNIQALEVIQEPRVGEDKAAFLSTFGSVQNLVRYWELTNTRLLFGMSGPFIDAINTQLDPVKKRFKQVAAFSLAQSSPGGPVTIRTNAAGKIALIEFTGALPRAALYSQWQVETNDQEVLKRLADPALDPAKMVFVSNESAPRSKAVSGSEVAAAAGTVEIASYAPKRVVLKARASQPSILLLNDRFAPDWRAWVDGKSVQVLRCNHIMRGVHLEPGEHEIVFEFHPPYQALYISLAAIALSAALLGWVAVSGRRSAPVQNPAPASGTSAGGK